MVWTPPARQWRITLAALALAALPALPAAAQDKAGPAARLRTDVSYLADDAREGRGPGTKGLDAAADYIAATFKELGLKTAPGAEGYFQPFEIPGDLRLGDSSAMKYAAKGGKDVEAEGGDFSPLGIGRGGKLDDLPVVFAGYGITAKDGDVEYDDYAGIDAEGKAVLILRHAPKAEGKAGPFDPDDPRGPAGFIQKARNAARHGARLVLLVNDEAGLKGDEDKLLNFSETGSGGADLPFVMLKRSFAEKLLAAAGLPKLSELEGQIRDDLKPRSKELEGIALDADVPIERRPFHLKNVIGVLEGSGPHADETIVVGAHYDHLGRGGFGSLLASSRDIHNGADDNASGTSMVIEMARRLSKRPDPLGRRFVFMTFSGEERGLLGSMYYCKEPLFPLEKTVAMVNFDMVGRLNDKDELLVYGTGTAAGFGDLVESLGKDLGFSIRKFDDGRSGGRDAQYFGASDHFSFYLKKVPVLFFFTNVHPDYHRPSDDTDLINFAGMARIADLGELILLDLARRPHRPEFGTGVEKREKAVADASKPSAADPHAADPHAKAGPGGEKVASGGRMPYLGTIPDYAADIASGEGVLLSGVSEGGPAEKGGIKGGDTVVRLGGQAVGTLQDYTDALRKHKAGETVEVVVKRADKEVTLKVTLGSRQAEE